MLDNTSYFILHLWQVLCKQIEFYLSTIQPTGVVTVRVALRSKQLTGKARV